VKDVSGREVQFAGDAMVDHLRCALRANAMAYAFRTVRLRREAAAAHARIQRQLDGAVARRDQAASQIAEWYGHDVP
jgi:predicted nucleic acid-binding protein